MPSQTCYLVPNPVDSNTLKPLSMKYAEALAWFKERLASHSPINIQEAIKHLEDMKENIIKKDCIESGDIIELYNVFNEYIFDEMFIHRGFLAIIPRGDDEWIEHCGGYCTDRRGEPEYQVSSTCDIVLFEVSTKWEKDLVSRFDRYIGIMLHEMSHAFFCVTVCACIKCLRIDIQYEGMTGHGIIWQQLTELVQNYARQQLGLSNIDLLRESSLGLEIYRQYLVTGEWYENKSQMQALGLDVMKVMRGPLKKRSLFDQKPANEKVAELEGEMEEVERYSQAAKDMLTWRIELFRRS